jgi:hypothetical protein
MIRVRIRDINADFEDFAEWLWNEEKPRPSLQKHVDSIVIGMRAVAGENYVYLDFETMAAFQTWKRDRFD